MQNQKSAQVWLMKSYAGGHQFRWLHRSNICLIQARADISFWAGIELRMLISFAIPGNWLNSKLTMSPKAEGWRQPDWCPQGSSSSVEEMLCPFYLPLHWPTELAQTLKLLTCDRAEMDEKVKVPARECFPDFRFQAGMWMLLSQTKEQKEG